jgi:murein DD-endopeptidase MepM/ murein hydrolase activator NlpD
MTVQQSLNFEPPPPAAAPPPRRPPKKPGYSPRRIALAAALGLVLVGGVLALVLFLNRPKSRPAEKNLPAAPAIPAIAPESALRIREEIIAKGRTLAQILGGYGFTGAEIERLKADVKPVFNLDKIIAGRRIRLSIDAEGSVRSLEYDMDGLRFLAVSREGAGFKAEAKAYPFETRMEYIWGTVEDNVISAFAKRNEKDLLALSMTDLFAWDIDFYTELRRGDAFRMVYEKRYLEGKFVSYGDILAAEFINRGRAFQAYRFTYSDTGKSDYFDREAKSVRKEFLRSPIPYAAVTSGFSYSRFHPILKVYTSHFGVDYGATEGTPVHATADGVVLSAGPNGAAGNMVHLRHKNSYETMYLHLSRIFVAPGERVEGGKVIGLVGTTGESTGPHLDYRIRQGGTFVNPLAAKFAPVSPLRPEFKAEFEARARLCDLLLDAAWWIPRPGLL